MAARGQLQIFLWAQKLKNLKAEIISKFKMAARGRLQIFLWAQKLKNLKAEIIQILQSHSARYRDVQVNCFKVLLTFKMAATDQLHFFCRRKHSKN